MVIHPLNSFYFTDRPLKDETPQSGLFNRFHADDIQSFYCI